MIGLHAQEYRGTITGEVTDPSGNVIQNAAVIAKSPEQTYNGKTDTRGSFYIPYVQPGTYSIRVDAPGFKAVVHQGVIVDVSAKVSQSFKLPIGEVTETVSVSDDTLQLSTADASGGTVLDPEKVQNLPLNGRQVYMLMSLTPGVRLPRRNSDPADTPAHAVGTHQTPTPSQVSPAPPTNSC